MSSWTDTASARRSTAHSDHRADRRAAIVAAAAEAIERYGADASTAQVAELAGVARPHVYRHFSSKDELVDEAARYAAAQLRAAVRPTLARQGEPLVAIAGPVAAAVDWAAAHPTLYRFITQRPASGFRPSRTHFLEEIVAATREFVERQGLEVRPPDAVLAGLMGMVDTSIRWWLDHDDEPRDALITRLSEQVWLVLGSLLERER